MSQESLRESNFIKVILADVFDLEYGLFSTFLMLFRKPARVITAYLDRKQHNYISPFKYLAISVGLLSVIYFWAVDYDAFMKDSVKVSMERTQSPVSEEIDNLARLVTEKYILVSTKLHKQFSNLTAIFILLPTLSLFSLLFFRKQIPGFSRHIAMNAYLAGQVNIVQALLQIPLAFVPYSFRLLSAYSQGIGLVTILFLAYAYYSLFCNRKIFTAVKSIVTPMMGFFVYQLIMALISVSIAMIQVRAQKQTESIPKEKQTHEAAQNLPDIQGQRQ